MPIRLEALLSAGLVPAPELASLRLDAVKAATRQAREAASGNQRLLFVFAFFFLRGRERERETKKKKETNKKEARQHAFCVFTSCLRSVLASSLKRLGGIGV